ncbi:hypothetical protein A6V39_05175 [Candidatus Mycoplasma haematobovis]|uniref:Uncharacterized protein n=1 Tax=Candidatus Mycoplasma haematobovis TaxID=432608 RepID=A0A1A9QDP5_9MOLU|nr:hypothetical protein [Candidatus Mycoplasma haematobovis]OAL09820.1 hypothetical protein A6V39_05175 [Candidatus Mycoplasma haematobovis]
MSKLLPVVAIGAGGTAVISGVGGYLLSTQNTKTIKESFKDALIDLTSKEDTLLKEKLKKLKSGKVNSNNTKLSDAKSKITDGTDGGLAELKQACQEIYDSGFTNKESKIFLDFQAYCARTNKDKITNGRWFDTGANWKTRYGKLNGSLAPKLAEIKSKNSSTGDELKDWCNEVADLVFEGDTDLNYINAQTYCGKTD